MNKKYKIGDKVYIINKDLDIEEKNIIAVINKGNEIKYQTENNIYCGINENNFFKTKHQAEVVKQNFLDKLRFKIGDLIIFQYKEFGKINTFIGRIEKIQYKPNPYIVTISYKRFYDITDEDIVLKIKNEYIENFGKIKDYSREYDKLTNELIKLRNKIYDEYELLEKELKTSFKKQFSFWNFKKKPLFKDRFIYKGYDDY